MITIQGVMLYSTVGMIILALRFASIEFKLDKDPESVKLYEEFKFYSAQLGAPLTVIMFFIASFFWPMIFVAIISWALGVKEKKND